MKPGYQFPDYPPNLFRLLHPLQSQELRDKALAFYPALLPAHGFRPAKNTDIGDDNTSNSPAWERTKPPLPKALSMPCLHCI